MKISDEAKGGILCYAWIAGLAVTCYVKGTIGLIIIALVTALCIMYLLYDKEKARKMHERKVAHEMFCRQMQELRGDDISDN